VNSKTKRLIKTILKFGLTIAALYYVFSRIEFSSVLELFVRSNWLYLFIALLLFAASKAVAAYRLNIYFSAIGLGLPGRVNLRLYLLGMFYNLFLPGGIGGDGYKIYLLQNKYKTGTARLFGAVLTDRLSGMTALAMLALLLFALDDMPFNWNWTGFVMMPFAAAALYVFCRLFYRSFIRVFSITLLYSLGVQILQLACAYFIIKAMGAEESIMSYLLVFLVSSIVAVLPVSIGGMGVRELTFLYGAELLAIHQDMAVSISLMFYLITALVSFLGLYFVVRPRSLGLVQE
jgi:uncharacterized membrane protein YbhN (UPF0104 family)